MAGTLVVRVMLLFASELPEQLSFVKRSTLLVEGPPGGGGNTCSLGPTLSGSGMFPRDRSLSSLKRWIGFVLVLEV